MSFQDGAGNYTMVSHELAKEVGLVCAAVYGAVWRYCQMKDGVCRASLNTIGNDINLNRATVLRSIEKLSDLGYLIDQTPDRRNAPHTYVIGRTVVIRNSLEVTTGVQGVETVAESSTLPVETVVIDNATVAYNNSSIETVAQNNATVAECNATVAESYLNRVFKRDSNKDNKESAKKPSRPPSIPAMAVFFEITRYFKITKFWQEEAGRIVGDNPTDLDFWRKVVIGWTGKYPTVHNIEGMLDFFKRREIPGQQNGAKQNGNQRTYKTRQDGNAIKPREMDGATIRDVESEIAELERRLGIGGNLAGATS